MTLRPRKSDSETGSPLWLGMVNSGAAVPGSIKPPTHQLRRLRRLTCLCRDTMCRGLSSTDAKLADERPVALQVAALQIAQQPAPLSDQHQQPATRVVVLDVAAEVLGQFVDALGEQRDLDFGGAG